MKTLVALVAVSLVACGGPAATATPSSTASTDPVARPVRIEPEPIAVPTSMPVRVEPVRAGEVPLSEGVLADPPPVEPPAH